jgi:hypothetical protein
MRDYSGGRWHLISIERSRKPSQRKGLSALGRGSDTKVLRQERSSVHYRPSWKSCLLCQPLPIWHGFAPRTPAPMTLSQISDRYISGQYPHLSKLRYGHHTPAQSFSLMSPFRTTVSPFYNNHSSHPHLTDRPSVLATLAQYLQCSFWVSSQFLNSFYVPGLRNNFFLCFLQCGDSIQGLVHARQALYHWVTSPAHGMIS